MSNCQTGEVGTYVTPSEWIVRTWLGVSCDVDSILSESDPIKMPPPTS